MSFRSKKDGSHYPVSNGRGKIVYARLDRDGSVKGTIETESPESVNSTLDWLDTKWAQADTEDEQKRLLKSVLGTMRDYGKIQIPNDSQYMYGQQVYKNFGAYENWFVNHKRQFLEQHPDFKGDIEDL